MPERIPGLEKLTRAATRWSELSDRLRRVSENRNRALWYFVAQVAEVAGTEGFKSRRDIRRLVRRAHPVFDSKTRSRYVRIIRAVVRNKPDGVPVREWVNSHGGISKCR